MSVATVEALVEKGQIRLAWRANLLENRVVFRGQELPTLCFWNGTFSAARFEDSIFP